jgi:hypothetical protein
MPSVLSFCDREPVLVPTRAFLISPTKLGAASWREKCRVPKGGKSRIIKAANWPAKDQAPKEVNSKVFRRAEVLPTLTPASLATGSKEAKEVDCGTIFRRSGIRRWLTGSNTGTKEQRQPGKAGRFQDQPDQRLGNINDFRKNQNVANSFNQPQWNNYRNNVNNFRNDRSIEINNNIQNHFDNNFNDSWWGGCGWYHGSGNWGGNPWWWWGATTLATAGTFLAIDAIRDAADQPPVYDYGVNVIYQGDDVYVDGKKTATAAEYSQQGHCLG